MAIGVNLALLDTTQRELSVISDQLRYYMECLQAVSPSGALHHSAYVGQILPWITRLAGLLNDKQLCAELVEVYPYWKIERLLSLKQSLTTIEAATAIHHAGRYVDGGWVMYPVLPITLTKEDQHRLAGVIRKELI